MTTTQHQHQLHMFTNPKHRLQSPPSLRTPCISPTITKLITSGQPKHQSRPLTHPTSLTSVKLLLCPKSSPQMIPSIPPCAPCPPASHARASRLPSPPPLALMMGVRSVVPAIHSPGAAGCAGDAADDGGGVAAPRQQRHHHGKDGHGAPVQHPAAAALMLRSFCSPCGGRDRNHLWAPAAAVAAEAAAEAAVAAAVAGSSASSWSRCPASLLLSPGR